MNKKYLEPKVTLLLMGDDIVACSGVGGTDGYTYDPFNDTDWKTGATAQEVFNA